MREGNRDATTVALGALRDLRRARRGHVVEQLDVMETLYRLYVGLIFGAIGLGLLGGAIADAPVDSRGIAWLQAHGPAAAGLAVALAVLVGARAGAHGGLLPVEAAELQYVLLAPIDRGVALRPAALRQLRVAALAGGVLGAVVGNFVFRRLPGSAVEWIACLALFGALTPLCFLGGALLTSGRRVRVIAVTAVGAGVLAWGVADLALGWSSSPATMLGQLAVLPLQSGAHAALAAGGIVVAAALICFGVLSVGGLELEAARRRAALAAELRFSASVRDIRAVVLLRRQLASERPRRRPWIRLGRWTTGRVSVWQRGAQSFLRWPSVRLARVGLLGVAAGAAAVGAWDGATPLLALPGPLLLVAALDAIEPLAQEVDHPTRRESLPVRPGRLIMQHLLAPAGALGGVVAIAAATAAIAGTDTTALAIGAMVLVPTAVLLACCAALSVTNDPYAYILVPQIGYAQSAAPVAIAAVAAGLPVLVAREAMRKGQAAVGAAASAEFTFALVAFAMVAFLKGRLEKRAATQAEQR